jgi:hypothetical protein
VEIIEILVVYRLVIVSEMFPIDKPLRLANHANIGYGHPATAVQMRPVSLSPKFDRPGHFNPFVPPAP